MPNIISDDGERLILCYIYIELPKNRYFKNFPWNRFCGVLSIFQPFWVITVEKISFPFKAWLTLVNFLPPIVDNNFNSFPVDGDHTKWLGEHSSITSAHFSRFWTPQPISKIIEGLVSQPPFYFADVILEHKVCVWILFHKQFLMLIPMDFWSNKCGSSHRKLRLCVIKKQLWS